MPTNQSSIVNRINNQYPELLQWNSSSSCTEFLQRVINEPEMRAENWGLLSKSDGEAGYTLPNNQRVSHDVIALPNGERVDIIQSASAHPTPGGPAWGVIPQYDSEGNPQWRPNNVWIKDSNNWPIYDSDAPSDVVIPNNTTLGFGWFCFMTAWADWPDEAKQNFDWIMNEINPKVFRNMLCVEGRSHGDPDPWLEAGVIIDSKWEDRYKRMLDFLGDLGLQAHNTVYGGRNQTPTYTDRYRFHDRIIAASAGRYEAIRSWEMMNEWETNKWTAGEVIDAGNDLGSKLPSGSKLSLSSPALAHGSVNGREPTNEEMQQSFDQLYFNHRYANECTIHTMRDGGKWSNPFAFNIFYPHLPKINNEPPGPGTSAGGEYTDAYDVDRDYSNTISAGWAMYVGHAEWCPWNGHLPTVYYNGWREVKFVKDLPAMPECAQVMKALSEGYTPIIPDPDEGGDEEMIPYDESKSIEFGNACNDVYRESGIAQDPGMISVHSSRCAWDYYVGKMDWDECFKKHINEFRAEYSLPPI